jgi:hypothetical protein
MCAFIVMAVFWRTVWNPLMVYLVMRAMRKASKASTMQSDHGGFVTAGSDCVSYQDPMHWLPKDHDAVMRSFHLGQELQVAALELPDPASDATPEPSRVAANRFRATHRLVDAADAFRRATPANMRKQIRAMAAHMRVMQEPEPDNSERIP